METMKLDQSKAGTITVRFTWHVENRFDFDVGEDVSSADSDGELQNDNDDALDRAVVALQPGLLIFTLKQLDNWSHINEDSLTIRYGVQIQTLEFPSGGDSVTIQVGPSALDIGVEVWRRDPYGTSMTHLGSFVVSFKDVMNRILHCDQVSRQFTEEHHTFPIDGGVVGMSFDIEWQDAVSTARHDTGKKKHFEDGSPESGDADHDISRSESASGSSGSIEDLDEYVSPPKEKAATQEKPIFAEETHKHDSKGRTVHSTPGFDSDDDGDAKERQLELLTKSYEAQCELVVQARESIHRLIVRRRALKAGLRQELTELVHLRQRCSEAMKRKNALREHIDEMLADLQNGASVALVHLAKSVDPAHAASIGLADLALGDIAQALDIEQPPDIAHSPEMIRALYTGKMTNLLQLKKVLRPSTLSSSDSLQGRCVNDHARWRWLCSLPSASL